MSIRDGLVEKESNLSDIAEKLSLDTLFDLLYLSDTIDGAIVVQETIKEIWKAHENQELRFNLESGIIYMLARNKLRALQTFLKLTKDDPEYAEAWNKLSTQQFMMGDMQSSMEAAERTLELQTRHFMAWVGLGLVQYETRRYVLAAQSFRRGLQLDPWSPASMRLASCLDKLNGNDLAEEEQRASEGTSPYDRDNSK